jgi:SAM-dependent methyltransferase
MIWHDRLTKAQLDPQRIQREKGVKTVFDWIELFSGFQSELPAPFAVIEVLEGEGSQEACEALRALRRNPTYVQVADIEVVSNRLWDINPVLYQIAELTNPGTAIDLGCGAGRDSVWLAANGWEVTAIDRLEGNIEALKKLRATYAPNDPITYFEVNLNETEPRNQYDLVLLHYCWDANYFELAKQCVNPNGILSTLAHSEINYKCFAHPRESRILKPNEINREGFTTIIEREFWSLDRHCVSIVLQRQNGG